MGSAPFLRPAAPLSSGGGTLSSSPRRLPVSPCHFLYVCESACVARLSHVVLRRQLCSRLRPCSQTQRFRVSQPSKDPRCGTPVGACSSTTAGYSTLSSEPRPRLPSPPSKPPKP